MPTIRDVAKLTGLSVGTVSNVLNNVPTVSEKNREKVYAAIAQLGYEKPGGLPAAVQPVQRHRLIIPDITNPFTRRSPGAWGTPPAVRLQRLSVQQGPLGPGGKGGPQRPSGKAGGRHPPLQSPPFGKRAGSCRSSAPWSSATRTRRPWAATRSTWTTTRACAPALEQVLAMGHRRIAFLSGLPDSVSSMRRLKAYRDVLADHGLPQPEDYVRSGDYTVESGQKALPALMALPEPPTAIGRRQRPDGGGRRPPGCGNGAADSQGAFP